ncbi:MAG: DNA ligase-associated DEXH box helicase, partial [Flavobacteriales bacterium]
VQVGGPKGVARFVQRAGRSGHQPGATSKIYFLPTNALELIEAASLRRAIDEDYMEAREPYIRSFDVLVQYLVTLAVSDGFDPDQVYAEISSTFSFESVSREEFNWCLRFITTGGESLRAYDEYNKVESVEGLFKVLNLAVARKHRMSIGTIVSDKMMLVKYHRGSRIGHVEEYFVSSLNPGDIFWFAGRALEMVKIKDLVVTVKPSNKESGKIPSWQGGRLNFSSMMSDMLRKVIDSFKTQESIPPEMAKLAPILEVQSSRSHLPGKNEFLIEQMKSKEGFHLFMFPFEGRLVHEGIASLLAYRLSLIKSISFSLAYNDYGLELLSDQEIPLQEGLDNNVFTTDYLMEDLEASINSSEMARRKFRDIAVISGMIFTGYPGKFVKDKHLQSSSSLIFDVFQDYDPSNLLLRQSFDEMIHYQLEINRFRQVLKRIQSQKLVITYPNKPTPLAFPIMVDRLREKLSSESLADRIKKMTVAND